LTNKATPGYGYGDGYGSGSDHRVQFSPQDHTKDCITYKLNPTAHQFGDLTILGKNNKHKQTTQQTNMKTTKCQTNVTATPDTISLTSLMKPGNFLSLFKYMNVFARMFPNLE
jgi:hypothetical protein